MLICPNSKLKFKAKVISNIITLNESTPSQIINIDQSSIYLDSPSTYTYDVTGSRPQQTGNEKNRFSGATAVQLSSSTQTAVQPSPCAQADPKKRGRPKRLHNKPKNPAQQYT